METTITSIPTGVRIEEAAAQLGVSLSTVKKMVRDNTISVTRIGRNIRVPVAELRRVASGAAR